jgi:Uma2 family endonuclease
MIVHSTDFKTNLGKYLDKLKEEDLYVLRNGKPAAKVTEYTYLTDIDLLKENVEAYDYSPKNITYEEFIERYEFSDERLEYIDGKVYAMGSPAHSHQKTVMNISNKLYNYFLNKKCKPYASPYDVHFEKSDNKTCVQPDIFVMCDEENVRDDKYYGVPDLVVEVLSPSSITKDTMAKLNLYWREGVSEYLLVDAKKKQISYWYFKEKEFVKFKIFIINDIFVSNIFDGLTLKLVEVFE